jgi:hypothetical protein
MQRFFVRYKNPNFSNRSHEATLVTRKIHPNIITVTAISILVNYGFSKLLFMVQFLDGLRTHYKRLDFSTFALNNAPLKVRDFALG